MQRIYLMFLASVMLALFLSGCVETALVYDPNVYHTGRTAGETNMHAQITGAGGMQIRNSDNEVEFPTNIGKNAFSMSGGLFQGLSDRFDIGGTAALGFAEAGSSLGFRLYGKAMLTERPSPIAVSLMPTLVYILGSNDTDVENDREASSYLSALELHLPMSYHLNRHFCFVVEPKALYLVHRAHFKAGPNDRPPWVSRTTKNNWFCPGMAFGMQLGPVLPEVTILRVGGLTRMLAGVGFNF
jgi:hypothetical protein